MKTLDITLLRASWQSWTRTDMQSPVGPAWLQWVWTLAFAAVIALVFTLVGQALFSPGRWPAPQRWLEWYLHNLVVSATIAVMIHATFEVLGRAWATPQRIANWAPWQRGLLFAGVPVACTIVGWPLGLQLAGADLRWIFGTPEGRGVAAWSLAFGVILGLGLTAWFSGTTRRLDAERRAVEAQLRLLQGQLEPHFLFNTLANVQALMETDVPRARLMLESFTDYLRAGMGSLRRAESTLGDEIDLAEAYLALMKTRMDERLQYVIEAAPELRPLRLPVLLLQPLVENAIHHGLEPKREGGRVTVHARTEHDELVVEVRDDGLGLDAPARPGRGAGIALATLRARLEALPGSRGSLTLEPGHPGTRAILRLPASRAPS